MLAAAWIELLWAGRFNYIGRFGIELVWAVRFNYFGLFIWREERVGVVLPGRELTGGATPTRGNTSILFLLFNLLILHGRRRTPHFTLVKLKFAKNRDGKTQHYGFGADGVCCKNAATNPYFFLALRERTNQCKKNANGCGGEPCWNVSIPDTFRISLEILPSPTLQYMLVFTSVFSSAVFSHAQFLLRNCGSASFNP